MTTVKTADDPCIAVIGGSGVYEFDTIRIVDEYPVETPFGSPSSPVMEAEMSESSSGRTFRFYFLTRHGAGHTISPSDINYRANIFALKKMGARRVISISAVGSLKEELPPTMIVLPDQFIDWTKGLRERTFFTKGMVGHVSTAMPVDPGLVEMIARTCGKVGVQCSSGGSYICIEGPQFSSKAESAIYRSFGASVIGMTNIPEAYLAKEAGMAYATIAMVTDYDCWREEHCSVEEIMKVLSVNYGSAQKIVQHLIPLLAEQSVTHTPENQNITITSKEKLTPAHKEILKVLLS